MTNDKFANLFGGPPRKSESVITDREINLASSIQAVTEEIVLRMARFTRDLSQKKTFAYLEGWPELCCQWKTP